MGSTTDKIKGRVKEAVGVLTDNDRLKREGQTDQVVGEGIGKELCNFSDSLVAWSHNGGFGQKRT